MMDKLYSVCEPLVEAGWFKWLMGVIILSNPFALAPQVIVAFTAPSVEGISVTMWFIFLGIQTALAFNGIRAKQASVFISMSISVLESLTVIITVIARS